VRISRESINQADLEIDFRVITPLRNVVRDLNHQSISFVIVRRASNDDDSDNNNNRDEITVIIGDARTVMPITA